MALQSNKAEVFLLILLQAIVPLVLALLSYIAFGKQIALSLVSAAFVVVLPNLLFALKLFQHKGAKRARQIANGFYIGEALKLMLSALLFVVVFRWVAVNPLVFFITYFFVQMMVMFAPLVTIFRVRKF